MSSGLVLEIPLRTPRRAPPPLRSCISDRFKREEEKKKVFPFYRFEITAKGRCVADAVSTPIDQKRADCALGWRSITIPHVFSLLHFLRLRCFISIEAFVWAATGDGDLLRPCRLLVLDESLIDLSPIPHSPSHPHTAFFPSSAQFPGARPAGRGKA